MTQQAKQTNALYFQMHGLNAQPPEKLNKALQNAIERMHSTLYGSASDELTPAELAVLKAS
jgi:hypothetical protein